MASQFHPEFKSRPERPHPLFDGFVAASHRRPRRARAGLRRARSDRVRRRSQPVVTSLVAPPMSLRPSPASDLAFTPSLGVRALGGFGTSIAVGAALGAAAWTRTSSASVDGAVRSTPSAPGSRRLRARGLRPDDPDRCPARRHRARVGGRRVLRPEPHLRSGFRVDRRLACRDRVGRVALLAGPGFRLRGFRRGGMGTAGRGPSAWRRCPRHSSPKGSSSGRSGCPYRPVVNDPGALVLAVEVVLASRCRGCCSAAASVGRVHLGLRAGGRRRRCDRSVDVDATGTGRPLLTPSYLAS